MLPPRLVRLSNATGRHTTPTSHFDVRWNDAGRSSARPPSRSTRRPVMRCRRSRGQTSFGFKTDRVTTTTASTPRSSGQWQRATSPTYQRPLRHGSTSQIRNARPQPRGFDFVCHLEPSGDRSSPLDVSHVAEIARDAISTTSLTVSSAADRGRRKGSPDVNAVTKVPKLGPLAT